MEQFYNNPLKKGVYEENFGIILELRGLNRTVRYKHLVGVNYTENLDIINTCNT
jgi:hypothetical protein